MARVLVVAVLLAANVGLAAALFTRSSPKVQQVAQVSEHPPPPYSVPRAPVALVIGDNFAEGAAGVTRPGGDFAEQTAVAMGWTLALDAAGGTGYVNQGRVDQFPGRAPYPARVSRHDPAEDVSYVLVTGGINDRGASAAELTSAVGATVQRVQQTWPKARVIMVGPFWAHADAPASLRRVRNVVRQEATARHTDYIDPIAQRWTTKSNESAMVLPDGINLTQRGQDYLAKRLVAAVIKLGVPVNEKVMRGSWFAPSSAQGAA